MFAFMFVIWSIFGTFIFVGYDSHGGKSGWAWFWGGPLVWIASLMFIGNWIAEKERQN